MVFILILTVAVVITKVCDILTDIKFYHLALLDLRYGPGYRSQHLHFPTSRPKNWQQHQIQWQRLSSL